MKKLKKNTFPLFILISRAGLMESMAQITQIQYKIFAIIVSINLSFWQIREIELLLSYCNIPFMNNLCRKYVIFCILGIEVSIHDMLQCVCYGYHYIVRKNYFTSTTMSNSISSKTSVEQDDVVLIYACAKKTFGFNA